MSSAALVWGLSALSVLGFGTILTLGLVQLAIQRFQFWPPPNAKTWQHKAFRALFRLGLYPLVLLSLWLLITDTARGDLLRVSFGLVATACGIAAALGATAQMGWRNAFGEARGLVTNGWFAWSRNPVYVATWLGLVGWGVTVWDVAVAVPLALWAVLYAVAPFLEEPWLEQEYGPAFLSYKARVRRFF